MPILLKYEFIKIALYMLYAVFPLSTGKSPTEAGRLALESMAARIPGADGGVIVISKDGVVGYSFNSRRMAWAYAQNDSLIHFGIDHEDDFVEDFPSSAEPVLPPDCESEGNGNGGGLIEVGYFLQILLLLPCVFILL